jgi:type I restriction enzyme R subunit
VVANKFLTGFDEPSQVVNNQDEQNRHLAFDQLMKQAMNQGCKQDLELYKR